MNFLFLFLLYLVPELAFAQTTGVGSTSGVLNVPQSDLSLSQLANIFGVVDGVLHGAGSQILGTMFGVYNAAVLSLGVIIISYIFLTSTLNTAHEGEVMGKKWSSIWIPLRSAAGVALLIPKASGYSFIQILVMWIVVQGIGAADSVWSAALNYMARGGFIVRPPQLAFSVNPTGTAVNNLINTLGNANTGSGAVNSVMPLLNQLANAQSQAATNSVIFPAAASVLLAEACMLGIQNNLQYLHPNWNIPSFGQSLAVTTNGSQSSIQFPGNIDPSAVGGIQYAGTCGTITWTQSADAIANPATSTTSDSRSIAVQAMVQDLLPTAAQLANAYVQASSSAPAPGGTTAAAAILQNSTSIYDATADYVGIMLPYLRAQGNTQLGANFIPNAIAVGWIGAGSYYYQLVQLNQQLMSQASEPSSALSASPPSFPSSSQCQSNNNSPTSNILCSINNMTSLPALVGTNVQMLIASSSQSNQGNPATPPGLNNMILGDQTNAGVQLAQQMQSNFAGMLAAISNIQTTGLDPVLQVASIGITVINTVEQIWIGVGVSIVIITALGAVTVLGSGIGVGQAVIAFIGWCMSIIGPIMITLFVAGCMMAYYIPMIPFFLFVFGAITWFMAVIEAMIAAPLVALGLAHPEGHEHLGKAEYAVMLLANIFLRPVLMIFGFITGIIICNVGIWVLNLGFANAWGQLTTDWLTLAYPVALVVIYMTVVLTIINRAFSLIYEIPNRVLRWVGGAVESTGEGHMLEEVKGATQRHMEMPAAAMNKGIEGEGDLAKAGLDKLGESSGGSAGKGGGGGGGGGGAGGGDAAAAAAPEGASTAAAAGGA